MANKKIRLLIADDHPAILSGLSRLMAEEGINVVAEVSDQAAICKQYAITKPDVCLLDYRFGAGPTGMDAAKEILKAAPNARICIFSQFDAPTVMADCYAAGALAFLPKSVDVSVLVEAIESACRGEVYMTPEISKTLAMMSLRKDPQAHPLGLNERETKLLLLLARGLTQAEIADEIQLSQRTVTNDIAALRAKLGVERQTDFTLLAVKHKLINP